MRRGEEEKGRRGEREKRSEENFPYLKS